MEYTLRPYQKEAVDKAMYEFNHYRHPFVLSLSVAAGKSLIIADICHKLNEPTLILQPSRELLEQNFEKLKSYGTDDISMYSASVNSKEIAKYTYATIQSIYKKPELFKHFKKIIIDETDLCNMDQKSSMYHKFFKGLGDIKVLGLTATPYRANRYTTIDRYGNMKYNTEFRMLNRLKNHFFKKIVYSKDIGELQDEGYIPKAKYIVSDTDWSALKLNSTGADFTKDSLERFADSKINQVLDILPTLKSHKKVLYFCSSISQARKLSQALASYNIECPVVTADTSKKERAEIIRRYRDGEITHMANVSTLLAGFDVPDIDAIVFLRATLSVRVLYQGIGRGFRLDPNDPNKVLTIYDIAGVTQRFGRIESLKVAGSVGNFINDFQPNTLVSEVGRIDGKVLSSFKITDSKMKAKLKHIAQLI